MKMNDIHVYRVNENRANKRGTLNSKTVEVILEKNIDHCRTTHIYA